MQVIVLDDSGVTAFVYDDSDKNGGKVPGAAVTVLMVRDVLRDAIDFLDDSTGRGGRTEVNE